MDSFHSENISNPNWHAFNVGCPGSRNAVQKWGKPVLVVLCLPVLLTGIALSAPPAQGQQRELRPEQYLAHGHFELAVFNRNDTQLLTATNNLAQLWNLHTGLLIQEFEGHKAPIHSLCFSQDERRILTSAGKVIEHGSEDPTSRLWDVATGKPVAVLPVPEKPLPRELAAWVSGHVISAQFSPDGTRILSVLRTRTSAPDVAAIWNIRSGKCDLAVSGISTYSNVTRSYEPVRFSPDGHWLAGLHSGGLQIRVWDAASGQLRRVPLALASVFIITAGRFDAPVRRVPLL